MLEASIAGAVDVARGAGIDAAVVRAEIRGARVGVEMPSHVAWVALTAEATARLAIERLVLRALAGRLPVSMPSSVVHRDRVCVRTRLSGRSGLEHHRRAMDDQAVGQAWARQFGTLFAAVHTALSADALAALITAGLPTRPAVDLDDVRRGATALGSIKAQRLVDSYEPGGDRTFLHGDLGSHNVVTDGQGHIVGLYARDRDRSRARRSLPERAWPGSPCQASSLVKTAPSTGCGPAGRGSGRPLASSMAIGPSF
jgi:phosphotransferase family enzyme